MKCREAERILLQSWDRPLDSAGPGRAGPPRGGLPALPRAWPANTPPCGTACAVCPRGRRGRFSGAGERPDRGARAPRAVGRLAEMVPAGHPRLPVPHRAVHRRPDLPAGREPTTMTQSEALLLRNSKNLTETTAFLDEAEGEGRRVMAHLGRFRS